MVSSFLVFPDPHDDIGSSISKKSSAVDIINMWFELLSFVIIIG
jgi:hypothetical protein